MNRLRLTAVLSHPVQYYAAWFRSIAASNAPIDLHVIYIVEPTASQQGAGFNTSFQWDVPLRDGYGNSVLRAAEPNDRVHTGAAHLPAAGLGAAIDATAPDAVLIFGWYVSALAEAATHCRRRGIPVMVFADNQDEHRGRWQDWARMLRTRVRLRAYDALVVPGQRARDYLLRCGAPPTKIFRVPHTVDTARFRRDAIPPARRAALRQGWQVRESDFVVLFAGKLEAKKRVEDAIEAVARRPGMVLVVAGDGEMRDALQRRAASTRARVVFAGFLNQSEIVAAYTAADCLVLPSDWRETWGLVVNEALAAGLPVAVSNQVGSAPDLVQEDVNGATFATGDIEQLAAALDRCRDLAAQPDVHERCRRAACASSHMHATEGLVAAVEGVTGSGRSPARVVASLGGMVTLGGLERMTLEILRVVRRHRGRVHGQVNDWENHRIARPLERSGATWRAVGCRVGLRRRGWSPRYAISLVADAWPSNTTLLRDAAAIDATHLLFPDVVTLMRCAPAAVITRLRRRRVILRVGTVPPRDAFYRRLWGAAAVLTDVIACNSAFTAHVLRELGVPESKLRVIYNTVASRERGLLEQRRRERGLIAVVGQLIPAKGVHLAIAALRDLLQRRVDARMVIAGDLEGWTNDEYGRYRAALLQDSQDLQSAGRLQFLGWREDVDDLLARAAVLCFPSVEPEGGPGVVLEAKAVGTPTVAFDLGPLGELVRHATDGWLCSVHSAKALADGMLPYLTSESHWQAASAAAGEDFAARFGAERFDAEWWSCFSDAAAGCEIEPAVVP